MWIESSSQLVEHEKWVFEALQMLLNQVLKRWDRENFMTPIEFICNFFKSISTHFFFLKNHAAAFEVRNGPTTQIIYKLTRFWLSEYNCWIFE